MGIPIPSSGGTLLDGGISIVPVDATNTHFKIGSCSGGVAGTIYPFAGTDTNAVSSTLGIGPLVDSTIDSLIKSGGKTIYAFKPLTVTTAGSSSSVTKVGTSPLITLAGAAFDYSDMIVRIVLGGAVGTATFQYSTDGGDTYSAIITTAATYLLPTNVTVTFPAGTYVAGDTESWTDTAPTMTSSDLSTALDTVIAASQEYGYVHIVGQPVDAATLLTIATMVDGKMITAFAAKKFLWCLLEAPAVDKALLITAFSAFVSNFVCIAAGYEEYTNLRTGAVDKRSVGRGMAGRVARTPLGIHHMRLPDDSDLSAMSGVVKLVPSGAAAATGYHDESATPGLNAARFSSMRTLTGKEGFFITNMLTMASGTSDYQRLAWLQIALRASQLYYKWSLKGLAARIRKAVSTGFILPAVADALEDEAEQFILTGLKTVNGDLPVDGIRVLINRADNLAADSTLRGKLRMIPPSFAETEAFEIGFAVSLT